MTRRSPDSSSIHAQELPVVRLLIVDSHEIARTGTRAVLDQTAHIRVIGEAATMADAVDQSRRLKPDVVLMELRLPDGSGIAVCRHLAAAGPSTQVLMLTGMADDEAVVSALRAGASGFMLKTITGPDLIRAIEAVAKGHSIFDRAVIQRLMAHFCSLSVSMPEKLHANLSAQQRRVMELVVQGKTNKEIATLLGLSDKTVKNYLSNVYEKLRVTRRAQATVSFLEQTRGNDSPRMAALACPLLLLS